MADILHDLFIAEAQSSVFRGVSEPTGLDAWWTLQSAGRPIVGSEYALGFGPEFDWRATVRVSEVDRCFELELSRADEDWLGTRVRFELERSASGTMLRFAHLGWRGANDHFRRSSYCWATYLRLLKRHLEHGESVPYEARLD